MAKAKQQDDAAIGGADLSDPVQRRFADLPPAEQDEWRVLLNQPGVFVADQLGTCQACRGLLRSGQLARRDMFGALGYTHAQPKDCTGATE